jgi:hypothetical protein
MVVPQLNEFGPRNFSQKFAKGSAREIDMARSSSHKNFRARFIWVDEICITFARAKLAQAMDMYASNFHIICEHLSPADGTQKFWGPGVAEREQKMKTPQGQALRGACCSSTAG